MLLSIVIPSRNPEAIFFSQISGLIVSRPDWQIIIVDDASDLALQEFLPQADNLTILRNTERLGAGACRNIGIREIRGEYTVFLDDDDFMHWDVIEDLITQMQAQPAIEMSVSAYRFLRDGKVQPAHDWDRQILSQILQGQDSRVVGIDGHEALLRMANFPWTKLYRSSFLRGIGLRFSETAVQNDIHAHWQSLLLASRILVTNRIQCTQIVNRRAGRVNNTSDLRRLQAFEALRETYDFIAAREQPKVEAAFWSFYKDLTRWMFDVASPEVRPLLMRAHVAFAGMRPMEMSEFETEIGLKPWEIWDMKQTDDVASAVDGETELAQDIAQWEACLAEISRLKRLAVQLRADNDHLRESLRQRTAERNLITKEAAAERKQLMKDAAAERAQLSKDLERERAERNLHISKQDAKIAELQKHMNSKANRLAIRLRKLYRGIVPFGGASK